MWSTNHIFKLKWLCPWQSGARFWHLAPKTVKYLLLTGSAYVMQSLKGLLSPNHHCPHGYIGMSFDCSAVHLVFLLQPLFLFFLVLWLGLWLFFYWWWFFHLLTQISILNFALMLEFCDFWDHRIDKSRYFQPSTNLFKSGLFCENVIK